MWGFLQDMEYSRNCEAAFTQLQGQKFVEVSALCNLLGTKESQKGRLCKAQHQQASYIENHRFEILVEAVIGCRSNYENKW